MSRQPPASSPPPIQKQSQDNSRVQVRKYRLITPLFGGGVEAKTADPVTLIRGPSIRGQLRFWWRATRGGQYGGDLADLRAAEQKIWGGAAGSGVGPSQVSLTVVCTQTGNIDQPYMQRPGERRVRPNHDSVMPPYVAFPLQPDNAEERVNMELPVVRIGVEFELTLRYPTGLHADIAAALWAWETFGGIGARTRRGCGALQCLQIDGTPVRPLRPQQMESWLRDQLQTHVNGDNWPDGVPHLSPALRFRLTQASGNDAALAVWHDLLDALFQFRQSRPLSGKVPGRSDWPEPDAIRRLTGSLTHPKHSKPIHSFDKFPRAQLGLPIVFKFKDPDVKLGDPPTTTLQGANNYNRMASRLIFRPLTCANERGVGLAAILEGPSLPPGGVVLKGAPDAPPVNAHLSPREADDVHPLDGEPDVLQAFLNFL